ncbi:hypothetical protein JS565_03660 [Salmonella enterica subsp. enterica serovar Senftenberg]|nr:hypothetical protein [Salmonella enterica subsp. enterica serovar Senftenberg]
MEWAAEICGLSADVIRQLAEEFTAVKPATVWIGYGCSVMSTAAPTFALSMPLSLCPATSVSKAAARVMAICILGL